MTLKDSLFQRLVDKNATLTHEQTKIWGAHVRKKMKEKNMAYKTVAFHCGLNDGYIDENIRGFVRPRLKRAIKILNAVGSSLDEVNL